MTKKQRDALRNANAPCEECGLVGKHAAGCSKHVKPPRNLSDPEVQEGIREPKPAVLTIGGDATELYPLPARWSRKFIGLFAKIVTASAGVIAPMTVRIGIAIENDDALAEEVFRFIARAEKPANAEVSDDEIAARAKQIGDVLLFDEQGALLDCLCDQNRVAEILAGPKPPAETSTR